MIQNLLCYHLDRFCGIAINFLMFWQNYCCSLLDSTLSSQHQGLLHCLFEHYLFPFCSQQNGIVTVLFPPSVSVIVMIPFKNMSGSL